MPLVSITRLRIRSWRFLPGFMVLSLQTTTQAREAPGNRDVTLLADKDRVFWTRTIWNDEISMRNFMTTGTHRSAMPSLTRWCDEASVVHWTQPTVKPPTWAEAHERMLAEGRPSKLTYPSAAHERFEIPAPIMSRSRERHYKGR